MFKVWTLEINPRQSSFWWYKILWNTIVDIHVYIDKFDEMLVLCPFLVINSNMIVAIRELPFDFYWGGARIIFFSSWIFVFFCVKTILTFQFWFQPVLDFFFMIYILFFFFSTDSSCLFLTRIIILDFCYHILLSCLFFKFNDDNSTIPLYKYTTAIFCSCIEIWQENCQPVWLSTGMDQGFQVG